jgi:hypothetical protein
MNWTKFVNAEESAVAKKSQNFYLEAVVAEILDKNTLANWVRETNDKITVKHY